MKVFFLLELQVPMNHCVKKYFQTISCSTVLLPVTQKTLQLKYFFPAGWSVRKNSKNCSLCYDKVKNLKNSPTLLWGIISENCIIVIANITIYRYQYREQNCEIKLCSTYIYIRPKHLNISEFYKREKISISNNLVLESIVNSNMNAAIIHSIFHIMHACNSK